MTAKNGKNNPKPAEPKTVKLQRPKSPPANQQADRPTEYEKDGAFIKEAGVLSGQIGLCCNFTERDGIRYLTLTNKSGMAMSIYEDQIDWLALRMNEFRSWHPKTLEKVNEAVTT